MFWLLLGHFATIFLSTNNSTTLEFNEPIEQVIYGGSKNDLFTYLSQNKKTLTLKPLAERIDSNLTIICKNKNYVFWPKMDQARPHIYIKIQDGFVNSSFKTVLENEVIKIEEGSTSTLIIINLIRFTN